MKLNPYFVMFLLNRFLMRFIPEGVPNISEISLNGLALVIISAVILSIRGRHIRTFIEEVFIFIFPNTLSISFVFILSIIFLSLTFLHKFIVIHCEFLCISEISAGLQNLLFLIQKEDFQLSIQSFWLNSPPM